MSAGAAKLKSVKKMRFRDPGPRKQSQPDRGTRSVPGPDSGSAAPRGAGVRLNKYLASAGVASRRGADRLVFDGRVRVNGAVVENPATAVRAGRDRVEVDGRAVGQRQASVYLLLNKPAGVVTTASDPQGRRTVLDLVEAGGTRLYPVGRLDFDSEGLLFLMNDGRLAFRLTHPRYEVEKTYRAELDGPLEDLALQQIRQGLVLEDGPTRPAEARRVPGSGGRVLDVTIHEGRNRQVRRMFEAVGRSVVRLRRIRFAGVELGGLAPGRWRALRHAEVLALKKLVGLGGS